MQLDLESGLSQQTPNLRLFPTISIPNRSIRTPPQQIPEKAQIIEDGIEVVAVEHRRSDSGKQLAMGDEGKEIAPSVEASTKDIKPLPSIPKLKRTGSWEKVSVRNRILILICIQTCLLLSTCLGVATVSRRRVATAANVEAPTVASSVPALQAGSFLATVGKPKQQDSACLAPSNESAVWSCLIAAAGFQLNILPSEQDLNELMAISVDPLKSMQPLYGLQPPKLDSVTLTPVTDPDFLSAGPAYHFRTKYNRTVLLNEAQIQDRSTHIEESDPHFMNVRPGDRPWSCAFNGTELEGFIYPSRGSSSAGVTKSLTFMNYTSPVMPFLPYVFKIEEQRVNGTQPYCVQMEMLNDGRLVTLRNEQGSMNVLMLKEQAPEGCRCQWMID